MDSHQIRQIGNQVSELALLSKLMSDEIQDGGDRYIDIHIFGTNSVIIAIVVRFHNTHVKSSIKFHNTHGKVVS